MSRNDQVITKGQPLAIVRIWDGIGNQMFQYAYARALKERGLNVAIDIDKAYEKELFGFTTSDPRKNAIQNFNISLPCADVVNYGKYDYLKRDDCAHKMIYSFQKNGLWKYRYYKDPSAVYSQKFENISGNCYIVGWFQSERYFADIRSILLNELTLRNTPDISDDIKEYLACPECVSVHARRGDYIRLNLDLPAVYYKRAVEQIKEKYRNPRYLVFSDDIKWARENLSFLDDALFVDRSYGYADYEEIVLMSMCKSNIISNSTFSWWGAWLNRNEDKTVIAPAKWPTGQTKDIIPKNWIIV